MCSEVRGFAGGIAIGWKESLVKINLLIRDFQFLDLQLLDANAFEWFFSPVYASYNDDLRKELWIKLQSIADSRQSRWLAAGDFNDILSQEEKKGGAPINVRKCNLFRERINNCDLMDMGYVGSRFTWSSLGWSY